MALRLTSSIIPLQDAEKKDLVRVMDGNVEANGHPKIRRRTKFTFYGRKPAAGGLRQYRPYSEKEIESIESAVDKWSRIGFPVSFMVFNIIYWVLTVKFSWGVANMALNVGNYVRP